MSDGRRSFWSSVPGLITGLAGLLTGVVGLITLLVQQGVIGHDSANKSSSAGTSTTVTSTVAGGTAGAAPGGNSTAGGRFGLSPGSLDFQPTDSKQKPVTIRNTGSTDLTNVQATVTGPDSKVFSVAIGDCTGRVVANLSCTVNVTFTPPPGALKKYTATLQVTASGATSGDEAALTATTLL